MTLKETVSMIARNTEIRAASKMETHEQLNSLAIASLPYMSPLVEPNSVVLPLVQLWDIINRSDAKTWEHVCLLLATICWSYAHKIFNQILNHGEFYTSAIDTVFVWSLDWGPDLEAYVCFFQII